MNPPIFLIAVAWYLLFSGVVVVVRKGNICGEGIFAMLVGLAIIVVASSILQARYAPNEPDWQISCVEHGGTLTHHWEKSSSGSNEMVTNCTR